jgi:hypothetical protein
MARLSSIDAIGRARGGGWVLSNDVASRSTAVGASPPRDAALVEADDPRWPQALALAPHDVYQLPSYATFAARHQHPGRPMAFVARDGDRALVVPLIVRPVPDWLDPSRSWTDAISPRGYAGPVATRADGPADDAFVARALDSLAAALRAEGIVTAFVRLHPLSDVPLDALAERGTVVEHGTSVSIDLTRPAEELRRHLRQNHRRDIDRARRGGYAARIDDRWQAFDAFLDAYAESMERLGSDTFWRLSRTYFEDLRAALGEHLHLGVVEREGAVVAGALLTEIGDLVEYHLAGTRNADVGASPSKLLIDFARSWAQDRGRRRLHLGGSLHRGDALNRFKLGFSPVEHVVASWRLVADPAAYRSLSSGWRDRYRREPEPDDGTFPAYRAEPAPEA